MVSNIGFLARVVVVRERFWERYSLGELNAREWEALCDGCGQCCLIRQVDGNEVTVYGVACPMLDIENNACSDYANRLKKEPSCHQLTPENVPKYNWLPPSCAYRRVHFGQPLAAWHPLLAGEESRKRMRRKGVTVCGYAVPKARVARRQMDKHIIARLKM